jgi:sugar phosphate isomerase/epimerase
MGKVLRGHGSFHYRTGEPPESQIEASCTPGLPKSAGLRFTASMHSLSCLRSSLLLAATLLLPRLLSAAEAGTGPSFEGPVGLQLYSLRADFTRNVPGSLDRVKGMGFRDVELAGTYNLSPARFKEMLDERGLRPVSGHFPYDRYRDDLEGVVRDARALGLRYAGCAWITHQAPFDEKQCRAAAAVFNKAGEALAKAGIKFFYHIHGFEFHPHGPGTLLDLLMAETKPGWVCYQMDVLWTVFPGQDPVKLLEMHAGRWELMHLKDLKKGVPTGSLAGKTDVKNDVVLGTGQMDWPAILAAARRHGVKHYFIEDESPTAAEQIPQSLRFLEKVRF